jgi:hypothetical protein
LAYLSEGEGVELPDAQLALVALAERKVNQRDVDAGGGEG